MFASVDNYITDTLPLKRAKVKGEEAFTDKNLPVCTCLQGGFLLNSSLCFYKSCKDSV